MGLSLVLLDAEEKQKLRLIFPLGDVIIGLGIYGENVNGCRGMTYGKIGRDYVRLPSHRHSGG